MLSKYRKLSSAVAPIIMSRINIPDTHTGPIAAYRTNYTAAISTPMTISFAMAFKAFPVKPMGTRLLSSLVAYNTNETATCLIKPGESDKVKAAIYNTSQNNSLFIKKGGVLYTLHHDYIRQISSPSWFLEKLSHNAESLVKYDSKTKVTKFTSQEWLTFLTYLNPVIVDNLQLQKTENRYLIKAYNLCLSYEPIATYRRSQAISSFPAISTFTGIGYNDRLLEQIDDGHSLITALKNHFDNKPWATTGFLNRISHYFSNSESTLRDLGNLLVASATNNDQFDKALYNKLVSKIPSAKENSKDFNIMLRIFEKLQAVAPGTKDSYPMRQVFINSSNDWQHNDIPPEKLNSFVPNTRDYLDAIIKDLILPEYLARLEKCYGLAHIKKIENLMCRDNLTLHSIIPTELKINTICNITTALTVNALQKYVDRWHLNETVINAQKPVLLKKLNDKEQEPEWHALIPNQNINLYSYTVLTNQKQLSQEGTEMGHCVGGYSDKCKSGDSHIIAGKSPSGERFTIELQRSKYGTQFTVAQLLSYKNSEVSAEITTEVTKLVKNINSGTIKTNTKIGRLKYDELITEQLGFDPLDPQARKNLFQAYKQTQVLPKQFQKCETLGEFLQATGIGSHLDEQVLLAKPKDKTNIPDQARAR